MKRALQKIPWRHEHICLLNVVGARMHKCHTTIWNSYPAESHKWPFWHYKQTPPHGSDEIPLAMKCQSQSVGNIIQNIQSSSIVQASVCYLYLSGREFHKAQAKVSKFFLLVRRLFFWKAIAESTVVSSFDTNSH